MKEEFHRCRAADARAAQKLKAELAAARIDTRHVRKLWYEVCEKQTKETDRLSKELDELREKYLKKNASVSHSVIPDSLRPYGL